MKYDREELDVLCESIDLLEYAEKTIEFKKIDRRNYACHCPLHVDKTPSLMINAEDNYFYCFSCGISGNIISWLRAIEGLSFEEAVNKVADLADVDVSSLKTSETVMFLKQFSAISHKLDKIERRVLDKSEYEKYSEELPQEWIDEGIPPEILRKYEVRTDPKAHRIVYPVYDNDFRLIGVKGRTRFGNYKQLKIAKYMNYHKIGVVDYFGGMKQARNHIIETQTIIIFEGIKSVMKADAWGWYNTVSSETARLNERQIKLLIEMGVKNVVIAYDKGINVRQMDFGMLKRFTNVFAVIDRYGLLHDKDAPVDEGREVWEMLYEERVRI